MKRSLRSAGACLALALSGSAGTALAASSGTAPAPSGDAPPGTPDRFFVMAFGPTVGAVSWGAVGDDRGVRAYEVTRDGVVVQRGPRRSYVGSDLSPDTVHRIGLTAIDTAGQRSRTAFVKLATPDENGGATMPVFSRGTVTDEGSARVPSANRGGAGGGGNRPAQAPPERTAEAAPETVPERSPGIGGRSSGAGGTAEVLCGEEGEALSRRTVQLINEFRSRPRQCGARGAFPAARPLIWDQQLYEAALTFSTDMAATGYKRNHRSSDGSTAADRIEATGYSWRAYAENIAWGLRRYGDVKSVVDGWIESDGHCANLMNPNVTEVALACASGSDVNTSYWTNVLAAPSGR